VRRELCPARAPGSHLLHNARGSATSPRMRSIRCEERIGDDSDALRLLVSPEQFRVRLQRTSEAKPSTPMILGFAASLT
jgi:hypothetical protein